MNEKASRRTLIRDAIVSALRDMGDQGSDGLVCSSGRCARLLESLLFTDKDDAVVKGVLTTEQLRNDAMEKSQQILTETIAEFSGPAGKKGNHSSPLANVARSYSDPEIQTDPMEESRFKEIVKGKIERHMESEYSEKLSPRDFDNIRDHCLLAIESI